MDIFSHVGWGYVSLRWKGKREAWMGAIAGGAPDLLFAIPFKLEQVAKKGWSGLGMEGSEPGMWRAEGPPLPPDLVHAYDTYYVWTHSLVVVAVAAGLLWLCKKSRPWLWLTLPYSIHILMDIPTHERFQTPFLYPLSEWTFQGASWGRPWIFWPNWIALLSVLLFWQVRERRRKIQ